MPIVINGDGTISGITTGGLPDGIVDTDMLANNAVTSAKSSGLGGLSMVDVWHQTATTNFNGHTEINSNWSRTTNSQPSGTIGSAMTESSGVFTFPSTGIYKVHIDTFFYKGSPDSNVGFYMDYTSNNGSSYTVVAYALDGLGDAGGTTAGYTTSIAETILDITDTSNQKVKFRYNSSGSGMEAQSLNFGRYVNLVFEKLGDT